VKEATGEANMTVITIVIIALVLAIGTPIVTNLLSNTGKGAACSSAGGYTWKGKCYASCTTNDKGTITSCSSAMTCTKSNNEWTCK